MSERVLVRKIEDNLWQWRAVNSQGSWENEAYYTGDVNLLKESIQGQIVWLILPGQNVVSQNVAADIKDRAQLIKILPFEVEDNVIDPVEEMHFSYGPVENDTISVAYAKTEWMAEAIEEIENCGAEVTQCSADYLQLPIEVNGLALLIENQQLFARINSAEGFTIEQNMAPLYLQALSTDSNVTSIQLFADSEEALSELRQMLPDSLTTSENVNISEQISSFWDLVPASNPLNTNFRIGKLARRLPFAKWWQDYKAPIITTAAAFILALTTTWVGQNKVKADRKSILSQTDEIYRQVVPSGKINDPHRQLRALIGKRGSNNADPSNAVYLISSVGPAIGGVKDIKVKSFRYNASKRQLQLNIEGNSYQDFEALRGKIAEVGFQVEIKSQSAHGEVFQAQFRVSEASS